MFDHLLFVKNNYRDINIKGAQAPSLYLTISFYFLELRQLLFKSLTGVFHCSQNQYKETKSEPKQTRKCLNCADQRLLVERQAGSHTTGNKLNGLSKAIFVTWHARQDYFTYPVGLFHVSNWEMALLWKHLEREVTQRNLDRWLGESLGNSMQHPVGGGCHTPCCFTVFNFPLCLFFKVIMPSSSGKNCCY